MKKLAFTAIAVTAFAALSSIPTKAENNGGGPMTQNGKCFNFSAGQARDARFGSWADCPQTASATTTTTTNSTAAKQRRVHHAASR